MALYDDLRNSAGNAWDSFKQYFNEGPEQPIAPASIDYGNAYQAQQAVVPNYNSNMVETLQQYTPEYENGELAPGNINLANRTRFDAGNGQQKTILGTSYNIDGVETLIPTVHPETGEDMGEEAASSGETKSMDLILDIPLTVAVELGRSKMLINDLLQLGQGSVIELTKLVGEPLEVLVNQKLVARGEVVVVNEKFGVRLTDIVSPMERVQSMA